MQGTLFDLFPNAEIAEDNDGQILIYTGMTVINSDGAVGCMPEEEKKEMNLNLLPPLCHELAFEAFQANIKKLDWCYEMTDDGEVYRKGYDLYIAYRDIARKMGGSWEKAFERERLKHPLPL